MLRMGVLTSSASTGTSTVVVASLQIAPAITVRAPPDATATGRRDPTSMYGGLVRSRHQAADF
jgi:hypothetical protein